MPTNEQRRASAKRKLAHRNERAAIRAKRRKRLLIFSALGLVVVVLVVVGIVWWNNHQAKVRAEREADIRAHTCAYKANEAEKKQLPKNKQVGLPPNPYGTPKKGTVQVDFQTTAGPIPVTMDRAKAPCTVQSIQHLLDKGFYDNTKCHREMVAEQKPLSAGILQCGDPLGTGAGGPGYTSPDELPKDLKNPPPEVVKLAQAQGQQMRVYPRGTIAMANSGKNTNGSQFFLVFKDTYLPPNYNVFGTIGEEGLRTIDAVAKAGIKPSTDPQTGQPTPGDGAPKKPVTITKATAAKS
ncbi:peptidylprolyl isomerase [Sciscionella sediminilitoris]|uniref:peptidylprolyl isomerase n=1 Tax=Sciscionella sediminilitoris TaxID=1445613 RepID=UPI0004DF3FD9|nr:peptidylprolyl isomerase [Sciscionella sp. SE31]